MSGRLGRALASLAVALLVLGAPRSAAAAPAISGSGELRTPVAQASFSIEPRGDGLFFQFSDQGSEPPRTISLDQPNEVECLGDLFGGQTARLSGSGSDSASPGEAVSVQVWLVDGGGQGADRISLKVKRRDDSVVYFAPLRDLASGQLQVACTP